VEELAQKVTGELTARVREVLRRPGLGASWISGVIQVGDLKLDLESHMLWRGDDEIHLSPKEFDLLAFMMKNVDVLLTHVKLLRSVWVLSTEANWNTYGRMCAVCARRLKRIGQSRIYRERALDGVSLSQPGGCRAPTDLEESSMYKLDALVEEEIVGDSLAIQYVLNQVRNVAKTMHQNSQLTASGGALLVVAVPCCDSLRIEEEQ
jgi:hypothetical protein